ncbi:MAG: hypothetical protein K2X27_02960 [Candidatus Obscuribacterales bacterium]|nr:hypothetical protein [Candidatus Obscuribacterales bacterium]
MFSNRDLSQLREFVRDLVKQEGLDPDLLLLSANFKELELRRQWENLQRKVNAASLASFGLFVEAEKFYNLACRRLDEIYGANDSLQWSFTPAAILRDLLMIVSPCTREGQDLRQDLLDLRRRVDEFVVYKLVGSSDFCAFSEQVNKARDLVRSTEAELTSIQQLFGDLSENNDGNFIGLTDELSAHWKALVDVASVRREVLKKDLAAAKHCVTEAEARLKEFEARAQEPVRKLKELIDNLLRQI